MPICYDLGMRRKKGELLVLEQQILDALGDAEAHGYAIARLVSEQTGRRVLPGHGTLYRTLDRLIQMDKLTSRWEDAEIAEQARRPRRRLYRRRQASREAASE